MKATSLFFMVASFVSGLVATCRWYQASQVQVIPIWAKYGVVEPPNDGGLSWISGILEAARISGKLNRIAALWTAGSVFLNAISIAIGACSIQ